MKAPFSTLVCTRKQKNGPSSADQALSIASCNSRHAPSARAVHPPSADQALSIASCNSRQTIREINLVVKGLTGYKRSNVACFAENWTAVVLSLF